MEINDITPDHSLDCVGLACPMPLLKTSNKIKEIQSGQILMVLSDDDGIVNDMPAWCRRTGHTFLGVFSENGEYKAYVGKK
jgi:tRNA 2-thiouridine synthesizing protein A